MSNPSVEQPGDRGKSALFISSVFAAAFLIFLVQPLVAKRILPWFGGSAGVWMLCLAFYQSALFVGYAYAYALIRFARPSLQVGIHTAVLALAVFSLPVLPEDSWRPTDARAPTLHIASMLVFSVALPFSVLASTGPLVQAWFARRFPLRSPYPLYAVSNIGSLLALVSYPFWIEPNVGLGATGGAWSIAFIATALAILSCAIVARRDSARPTSPQLRVERIAFRRALLWVLLSATAVIMLMGVTNHITLDVASVPFLWILPLGAYLATFILCFASERLYLRDANLLIAVLCAVATFRDPDGASGLELQIALYCALLFSTCMLMHGELYKLRPASESLTTFYLCISGGGALGGLFVGLVAPQIFGGYHELPLGLAVTWGLVLFLCRNDPTSWLYRDRPLWRLVATGVGTVFVATLFFIVPDPLDAGRHLYGERNFFGILRVSDKAGGENLQRHLMHGSTLHGMQLRDESLRSRATTYFGSGTAIGVLMKTRVNGDDTRVGVIGLGIGTLASYGRPGDLFRFYEIDPAVIRIAENPAYFDFLAKSASRIEIVEGDGRLSLEAEHESGSARPFDILVIDAFTSDAIPVHLLTQEAFEIYRRSIADDGVLAIHVSNRHFDLAPIAAKMGQQFGLSNIDLTTPRQPDRLSANSRWIFLSPKNERIDALAAAMLADRLRAGLEESGFITQRFDAEQLEQIPVWSDDFSDLFGALRH